MKPFYCGSITDLVCSKALLQYCSGVTVMGLVGYKNIAIFDQY